MSDDVPSVGDLVPLARRLQELCVARRLTCSTAESCTGGLIGHALTEVAGSSEYYVGGAIVYSDALKRSSLGVPPEMLARHGAVSAQVAVAMAHGARAGFGTDLAVAVTGIAGPSGGSDAKPVGLTYVAVADAAGDAVQRFVWNGDRGANKILSAEAAIRSLIARLDG